MWHLRKRGEFNCGFRVRMPFSAVVNLACDVIHFCCLCPAVLLQYFAHFLERIPFTSTESDINSEFASIFNACAPSINKQQSRAIRKAVAQQLEM